MTLTIKKLSVSYADNDHALLALDRVDLQLEPGRVTALVGESGSGKTTLGKAVMGLLTENAHVSGSICLDDDEIVGLAEVSINRLRGSKMAMVFQNGTANLNPVYRLVDQVAEHLIRKTDLSRKAALQKAEKMLQQMGLSPEHGRRYPHQLSGGQVQRGLLAMALMLDPQALILDEPTAALDAMTQSFVADVIRNLKRRDKTILLITHDLDLAHRTADEIAVLYLGQVMEVMPGRDLLHHARHPYASALAGAYPSMETVRDLGGIRGDAFYRMVHHHASANGSVHSHGPVRAPEAVYAGGHAPAEGCLFQPRCTQAVSACTQGEIPLRTTGDHRVRCLRGGIVDLIRLEKVAKSYDSVQALHPTDSVLRAGEIFCLVGETGSGKTTLAMIAAGALCPDQGRRFFDGRNMDAWINRDYHSLALKVGVIYQNPAQAVSHRFPVFDIVAEPLRIQNGHLPKQELQSRVLSALADVRLSTGPEFLKRYPHELNMGALQRVCLARALVHRPVLLIADEPTSSLDPSVQAKVLKMLMSLKIEKGLTMLFVTHDLGLARKIGDRIGVMLAGRIVEVGPAECIVNRPGHPYTRLLLESAKGWNKPSSGPINTVPTDGVSCPFINRCMRPSALCHEVIPGPVNLDGGGGQHVAWCCNPRGCRPDTD